MNSHRSEYESVEDIILRHSGRGMTLLRQYLAPQYCRRAAEKILNLERGNLFLTTGFYVAGHAETDGPPGAWYLARALRKLGFEPVIVTDRFCEGLFEPEHIAVEYVDLHADTKVYQNLLKRYRPAGLISIERCGRNTEDDYANMRGISIADMTAHIDTIFEMASRSGIPTIGIGDGGNEIGMGNLCNTIAGKLSLTPCAVRVDDLIIATVSNWGAYALVACLELLSGKRLMTSPGRVREYLNFIVSRGCVDGVTRELSPSVDGFPVDTEQEIVAALEDAVHHT